MRILITTGLTSQDSGGPAQYGPKLKEEFEILGHKVRLTQYSSIESALFTIWPKALWAERIIALDTLSVGVPSLLACKLFGKKIIVRIGGDFLWESYIERTGEKITLRQFNTSFPRLNTKEKIIRYLTRLLTKSADTLAFSTEWQKNIWQLTYDISNVKSCVVRNYIPDKKISTVTGNYFLWAGRKIKLKNVDLLKELSREFKIEIVSRLPHAKLQEKIKNCYAVILPSFSEVCPNFILEAASFGKPFIVTEETGLKEIYNKGGIFVNPFDKKALKEGILEMLDDQKYQQYKSEITSQKLERPWRQVAEEFLSLCQ